MVCVREQTQYKLQPGCLQTNKTTLAEAQSNSGGQTSTSHPYLVRAARAAIGQRQDGRLVGIVSIGDVVKNRMQELQAERQQLRDYITQGGS
jgi:CBS domain-containing protein